MIREALLVPPLVLNPPVDARSGVFEKTDINPADRVDLASDDWLCYPARVGDLLILVYFYKEFFDLGLALCNLFELASIEELARKPDAVYFFGVPGDIGYSFGESPTVFHEDETNGMLVASVPCADRFGYFGYLKKMVLTLHNIKMMQAGKLPASASPSANRVSRNVLSVCVRPVAIAAALVVLAVLFIGASKFSLAYMERLAMREGRLTERRR